MIQDWSNIYVQNLGAAQRKLGITAAAFMPPGGLTGEVLAKNSPVNFDVGWTAVLGPGGIVQVGNGLVLGAPNTLHFAQAAAYTIGDLFTASGATTVATILDVATGNALLSGGVGVIPAWGKVGLTTHVTGILPVANGGTGTGGPFTAGSVIFIGPTGLFAQNNANLFWDDTNHRLGIGITPPLRGIHVIGRILSEYTTLLNPAASYFGIESNIHVSINANNTWEFVGFYGMADHSAGGGNLTNSPFASGYAEGGLVGALGFSVTTGVVTVTGAVGLGAQNLVRTGCTVTNAIGLLVVPFYNDTGNNITIGTGYGIYIKPAQCNGIGWSVTTQYGLFVATMLAAGTRWAVYVQTNDSYFGGNVGVAMVPVRVLDVTGNAGIVATATVVGYVLQTDVLTTNFATGNWGTNGALNVTIQSTNNANNMTGGRFSAGYFLADWLGSGTMGANMGYGLVALAQKTGTGAVTSFTAVLAGVLNNNAAGAITTGYCFVADSPQGAGAITAQVGLAIALQKTAGAVTGYGLAQQGSADLNYFTGFVGFGVDPPLYRVHVADTFTTTAVTNISMLGAVSCAQPNNVGTDYLGYRMTLNTTTAANFTASGAGYGLLGMLVQAGHSQAGTMSLCTGGWFRVFKNGTGVVAEMNALKLQVQNNVANAVTLARSLYVMSPQLITGTMGTNYGIYLDDQMPAGVTTGYGIYQVGATTLNVLLGKLGVGMSPVRMLDVTGTFGATGAATLGSTLNVTGISTLTGQVILGTASNAGALGQALDSGPTSTILAGTYVWGALTPIFNPAAASAASFQGLFMQPQTTGAQNFTGSITGINMQSLHWGTGTCTLLVGGDFYARKVTTGAVTVAICMRTQLINANATVQIGTGYGIYCQTPLLAAIGFVTTAYGVYIDDQMPAGVTTGYGIYQVGATTLNVLLGKSGFGVAASTTAWAVLAASTATLASLRITAGSAGYAGTVEGDFWNDFTQKCLIGHIDGLKQFDVRASFVGTATVTITSTNVETTMFGAGVGTLTFPANFFVVGKSIRIAIRGYHTMDATPPTITFRVKLGGVTFASVAYTDLNDTNKYFELSFILTCRTTGGGGTGIGQGIILMTESTGVSNTDTRELVMTATAAMNTAGALTLDVTAHPNVADAGSSVVLTNHLVEVLA